jgi:hypothetical protein
VEPITACVRAGEVEHQPPRPASPERAAKVPADVRVLARAEHDPCARCGLTQLSASGSSPPPSPPPACVEHGHGRSSQLVVSSARPPLAGGDLANNDMWLPNRAGKHGRGTNKHEGMRLASLPARPMGQESPERHRVGKASRRPEGAARGDAGARLVRRRLWPLPSGGSSSAAAPTPHADASVETHGGCRTNRSTNRCTDRSWDNTSHGSVDRLVWWENALRESDFTRSSPTAARAWQIPRLCATASMDTRSRHLAAAFPQLDHPVVLSRADFDGDRVWWFPTIGSCM